MAVNDHGLEVLKKSGVDIGVNPQTNYALQVKTVEPISISTDSPLEVFGTVALDSASLISLENITVTVGSEVEISNDSGNPVPVTDSTAQASLASIESKLDTANTTLTNLYTVLSNSPKTRYGNNNISVASGATTVIFAYTVPTGKRIRLDAIYYTGTNIGQWAFNLGGVNVLQHTMFTQLSGVFPCFGELISAGSVVQVSVTNPRPSTGTYSAILIGDLENV